MIFEESVMGEQVDDAAVNALIKAEVDKINDSLAKISQTLNVS